MAIRNSLNLSTGLAAIVVKTRLTIKTIMLVIYINSFYDAKVSAGAAMNFKQLEAFYWLTKLQSYQRVADHICLTQPAVSARILGLEENLGVKLIDRSASEFRLTEQGHE